MTEEQISIALQLIDEWVAGLPEEDLPDQCNSSGRSFFHFLQARGMHKGTIAKLFIEVAGHHPTSIVNRADAETLRQAITGYESTQVLFDYELPKHSGRNPKRSTLRTIWEKLF